MKLKVLGTGCPNCKRLFANTQQAVRELGLDVEVEMVDDIQEIMKFKIMATPALVINEQVRFSGRVPSTEEIKRLVQLELGGES